MKPKGYIFFCYDEGEPKYKFQIGDICMSKKEMMREYHNHWDDKWDIPGRSFLHYFYLNLSTGEYHPLKKWKYDINSLDRFESKPDREISTKIFK